MELRLLMISRLLKLKDSIAKIFEQLPEFEGKEPSPIQYQSLKNYVDLMKPLADTAYRLEGESFVGLSEILVALFELDHALKEIFQNSEDRDMKEGATILQAHLERRFSRIFDSQSHEFEPLYSVCTLLDPRYKPLLKHLKLFETAKKGLKSLAETYLTVEENEDGDDEEEGLMKILKENDVTDGSAGLDAEIEHYSYARLVERTKDPVADFWVPKKDAFPVLYRVASHLLVVPASSAASEGLFSRAANVCKDSESRVSPKKIARFALLDYSDLVFQGATEEDLEDV